MICNSHKNNIVCTPFYENKSRKNSIFKDFYQFADVPEDKQSRKFVVCSLDKFTEYYEEMQVRIKYNQRSSFHQFDVVAAGSTNIFYV